MPLHIGGGGWELGGWKSTRDDGLDVSSGNKDAAVSQRPPTGRGGWRHLGALLSLYFVVIVVTVFFLPTGFLCETLVVLELTL